MNKEKQLVAEDRNKGTSYRRKQEDAEKQAKKSQKKKSKRLSAYGDNARAKNSEMLRNYINGNYEDEDF